MIAYAPLRASSPYSASKAGADLLVLAYCRTYHLPATISRCTNNYGPYQYPEKLIPLIIRNVTYGIPLPIYGTGRNIRDWIHVADHCHAIDQIIHNGQLGSIYNVGAKNEMTNLEIVDIICKEMGISKCQITFVPDRPGHDLRYSVDITKIQRELGWYPRIVFSDGIKDTIKWYIHNTNWSCN